MAAAASAASTTQQGHTMTKMTKVNKTKIRHITAEQNTAYQSSLACEQVWLITRVLSRMVLSLDGAAFYRRAQDGQFYTQQEFHDYYGVVKGEVHWENARQKPTQWHNLAHANVNDTPQRRTDDNHVEICGIAAYDNSLNRPRCSAAQPAASVAGDAAIPGKADIILRRRPWPMILFITCGVGAKFVGLSEA